MFSFFFYLVQNERNIAFSTGLYLIAISGNSVHYYYSKPKFNKYNKNKPKPSKKVKTRYIVI